MPAESEGSIKSSAQEMVKIHSVYCVDLMHRNGHKVENWRFISVHGATRTLHKSSSLLSQFGFMRFVLLPPLGGGERN